MTSTFYLTKEIEVKTNITIVKKDSLYYAVMEQEGYNTTEIVCFIDKFGQADADTCETDDQWNAVTETFQNYIIANGVKYARKCDKCGKGMNDGFVSNGTEYYCSNECLCTEYTKEEWLENAADEDNDSYWTEWDDSSDYQFVLFDNQLIEIN
jgi:hypothetical protein